jgi:mono/diheme cytochrome c family protein
MLFLAGCFSQPTAESIARGKALAETRCTACHSAVEFQKHRYTRGEWLDIIDRMMSHGAQFSPEERNDIADYLSVEFGR